VKVEMDLEMLRFELSSSDLENAYQAWLEVEPDTDYERFV